VGDPMGIVVCSPDNCPIELGRGKWDAHSLKEAKEMAIDFSKGVG